MSKVKKTPFYEKHLALQAKMVDYSGWLLPVQYSKGLVEEVHDTRRGATLFDVSHMGEIAVRGRGAEAFLQHLITNDISKLKDNAISYSPVCFPGGGVVDDILIYRVGPEDYLLVVNAANTDQDYSWFREHAAGDVSLENLSDQFAQVALQGPNSQAILQELTTVPLSAVKYYHFLPAVAVAGIDCLVSRTGYTGEDGFEIYCPAEQAGELWEAIWESGRDKDLNPAGLGARDVLRLEASMPLYGHEMSREITPLQAGLDRFVALEKEPPFIGQEALKKQQEKGLTRKLHGLVMLERGVAREGYTVLAGEKEIGWVSSGSYSPTLDRFIAMAFLDPAEAKSIEELTVMIRKRPYRAQVVKMPFYRREKR